MSREQLYERVWTTPIDRLAYEFGISGVALGKTCRRMNVPVPPRGYWARVSAGQKPKAVPLPPGPPQFDGYSSTPPDVKGLQFPEDCSGLHPVAREARVGLRAATPDNEGHLKIGGQTTPHVEVTKAQIDRAARALHFILMLLEARGIEFRKARSKYDKAYFLQGGGLLYLSIDEPIVTVKREPTDQEKRCPSWEWKTQTRQPAGHLTFSISDDSYGRGRRRDSSWSEDETTSLEATAQKVADGIWEYYRELERKREADAQEAKKREEQRKVEEAEERKRKHASRLKTIEQTRADDLFRAAEWWRIYQNTLDYINGVERGWKTASDGALSQAQIDWLDWARKTATTISPAQSGYPEPSADGAFDAQAVPFGGPYPHNREFSRPPTMPDTTPPQREPSYGYSSYDAPAPKPYPFWLKYQKH